jgi:phage I-like protein
VRLSAEEREMATMMGMTPEDYARNKVALKREGKLH